MKNLLKSYLSGVSLIKSLTYFLSFPFLSLLSPTTANASCQQLPSCADMGYSNDSCYPGATILKCPFDQTKLMCVNIKCTSLGYNLSTCPADYVCEYCPFDPSKMKKVHLTCAKMGYVETSCPGLAKRLSCPYDATKFFCGPAEYRTLDECKTGDFIYFNSSYSEGDAIPQYFCLSTSTTPSGIPAFALVFDDEKHLAMELSGTNRSLINTETTCAGAIYTEYPEESANGWYYTTIQMDSTCGNLPNNAYAYCLYKNNSSPYYTMPNRGQGSNGMSTPAVATPFIPSWWELSQYQNAARRAQYGAYSNHTYWTSVNYSNSENWIFIPNSGSQWHASRHMTSSSPAPDVTFYPYLHCAFRYAL